MYRILVQLVSLILYLVQRENEQTESLYSWFSLILYIVQGENECTESLYSWFTGEFSTDHISIKTGNLPKFLF